MSFTKDRAPRRRVRSSKVFYEDDESNITMRVDVVHYVSARRVALLPTLTGRPVGSLQSVHVDHVATDTHIFEGFDIGGYPRFWRRNAVFASRMS